MSPGLILLYFITLGFLKSRILFMRFTHTLIHRQSSQLFCELDLKETFVQLAPVPGLF